MATKKISTVLKLQIPAGQASPAPPVGPALGQYGLNIMDFVNAYNQATQSQTGTIVPVEITVYEDRSFSFITKTPPAAVLLRQAAKIPKGSPESNRQKVGSVTRAQIREIAETKMPDLNANDIDAAMKIVEGTARSMGLLIAGEADLSVIQTTEEREAIEQAEAEAAAAAAAMEQAAQAEPVATE